MGEQLPDRNGVVCQTKRAEVIVGRVIQADPAVRDQPQHGGGGDQLGEVASGETVAGAQDLGAAQIRPAPRGRPVRGIRAASGQDEAGQAELGDGLGCYLARRFGDLAGGARGRRRAAGVGDPAAQRKPPHSGDPVRRVGLHRRDDLQVGDLDLRGQRCLGGDDIRFAQVLSHSGDGRDQLAGRSPGQELLAEMLSQLADAWGHPVRASGIPESGRHPSQLRQHIAFLARPAVDELFQRGPARLAMLPRDGQLSLAQGGELSGGQAAFRLQLQVPQARPAGQRARCAGHVSSPGLISASGGAAAGGCDPLGRLHHLLVGRVDRGRAAGDRHEPDMNHRRCHPVP